LRRLLKGNADSDNDAELDRMTLLKALLLGIIEGATEFLPVSSTGHLIVASTIVDYPEASRATFEIFIQLGAILAVVWHFRVPLWETIRGSLFRAEDRGLLAKVLLAFLPAAVVGLLFHRAIERYLFSPFVVGITLMVGGIVIVVIERRPWSFSVDQIDGVTWRQSLWVGLAQVLSMIPGVSRAGATIIGGMFAGLNRPAATQFSFYLSIPTMAAASLYSLFKARADLVSDDALLLAVGFATAFFSALLVVRAFLAFVQRHDFTPFGYYRIVFGALLLWFFW
jgi:undecaprenyl-diphosphatase